METSCSGNKNGCDERIALGASLFLHALLFLVLSSSSEFAPLTGPQTRIDFFWLAATPAAPIVPAQPSPPPAAPPSRELRRSPVPASAKAHPPSRPFPAPGAKVPPPSDHSQGRARDGIPAAIDPAATGIPPALKRELPGPLSSAMSRPREAKPSAAPTHAPTMLPPPTVAGASAADKTQPPHPGKAVAAAAKEAAAEPGPHTATPAGKSAIQQAKSSENPVQSGEEPTQQLARAERAPAAAGKPDREPPLSGAPAVPQQRGMVAASLSGDLKLVSSGDSVKISVLFREFPRSRRSRPPGRSEARRLQNITPVCADGPGRTSETVIEKAHEGVYVFSAEPRGQTTAQASFTLKIYDSGSGKKVAELGRRSISQKSVVARVLMPEAILWDDDSAFTGSLQDSESTTKFNSQSGLYWKEYDD